MASATQEAIELELGVFAGLVADLDAKDDHVLSVLQHILERATAYECLPVKLRDMCRSTELLVVSMISGETGFEEGYQKLCDAVDVTERWLAGEQSMNTATSTARGGTDSRSSNLQGTASSPRAPGQALLQDQNSASDIQAFISECRDYLDSAELDLVELEKDSSDKEKLNEVFRCFHNMKGASGFLALSDIQSLAHSAESLMEEVRSGHMALSGGVAELGFRAIDYLGKMLDVVEACLIGEKYATPEGLDELVADIEAQVSSGGVSSAVTTQAGTHDLADAPEAATTSTAKRASDVVRVSTSRLDSIVDAVGELVIANSMVSQDVQTSGYSNPRLIRNLDNMAKIIRELQELATGVRMVTLEGTFRKMARVIRDISVKTGVAVDFVCEGGETELDRSMVEEMNSPLMHLVRNAVDHGLESLAERQDAGKPEKGRVRLSALHQGGNVVIKVEDDGRGLDRQAILKKAVTLGLVKSGTEMSDREVYQLIYLPGFSTASKVTEISGRGVGMDVVKKAVDGLHGRIDVTSTPGLGTTFTIRLPLTMAIIDGMVFRVAGRKYIVPVTALSESLRPTPDQIHAVADQGEIIQVRDEFVPLIRLHRLFSLDGAVEDPCRALVLIVADGDEKRAVLIDDLVGEQQVVVKPLDSMFSRIEAVAGAAVLGDGMVSLILDVAGLIQISKGA